MQRNPTTSDAAPDTSSVSVAMAVARQRLHDAHFAFVLELIQKTQGQVPAPRALSIYARMHGLNELDIQALRNRVLIHLSDASAIDVAHLPNTFVAIDGAVEWDITASLVQRIRKRLTGRKLSGLRRWIDLHGGYVESELMKLHVENLVVVADTTGPDVAHGEIVRAYATELGVSDRIVDVLHAGLLAALYERMHAPRAANAGVVRAASRAASAAKPAAGKVAAPLFPDAAYRNA